MHRGPHPEGARCTRSHTATKAALTTVAKTPMRSAESGKCSCAMALARAERPRQPATTSAVASPSEQPTCRRAAWYGPVAFSTLAAPPHDKLSGCRRIPPSHYGRGRIWSRGSAVGRTMRMPTVTGQHRENGRERTAEGRTRSSCKQGQRQFLKRCRPVESGLCLRAPRHPLDPSSAQPLESHKASLISEAYSRVHYDAVFSLLARDAPSASSRYPMLLPSARARANAVHMSRCLAAPH